MNLPEKLAAFKPYPAMTGAPPVRLDGNESCFCIPQDMRDEIAEAVRHIDLHRYPDPYAAEVCASAERFWGAPEGSAVAGNGSDELISIALGALLPRGGKLLVCDPDFTMYRFYAALYELDCIGLDRFSGVPDTGEIIQKGKNTDAVILSNPCNPTGQALPLEDVLRVVEALDCPVLLDEAYMDFWDGGKHSVLPYIKRYKHLIVLKTCSKNLALAGIRLGFAFAGEELASLLRSVKSPYNVSALAQAAGAVLLQRPEWIHENTARLMEAKDRLYKRLSGWARDIESASVTDTVANFVLLTLPDAEEWHTYLQSQGISVRLAGGALRITAGTEAEEDALLAALNKRWEDIP
ncbi:MAG: histidinol-phosphate aminotransferase family protein [Oscillospiraceae bacterium]|jgi:histidinol-phosphate aminotransferase|nr:histidinol-phosphate aminotransferase family protein [Oscillospiraceae bacterium]